MIIPHQTEPNLCPSCRNVEAIKETCRHCGFEYETELSIKALILIIISILILIWFFLTIFAWLSSFSNETLLEVLQSQWEWIKVKRIW